MRLLIDGYNLLHASGLFGDEAHAGSLYGAREALVGFLVANLGEKERRSTVVIFDAKDAPAGLPDRQQAEGISIRFARGYADADALIEELLETAKGARALTVVSGDHRVQRAARRAGASPIDADVWIREVRRRRPAPPTEAKPRGGAGSAEEWIDAFSDPDALARIEREATSEPLPARPAAERPEATDAPKPAPSNAKRPAARSRRGELSGSEPKSGFGDGVFNPFPPGYAEDLTSDPDEGGG